MKIPYLDLSVKDVSLKNELLQAVDRVLSHGRILLGPEVEQFEKKVAEFCQKKYAVGVNSGTDALYLALRSLDVGPGDEVITTPLSWIATLNAITLCGANPVFVDIKEDLNINADLIDEVITPKTKAILPVHFTGKLCNMDKITQIAKRRDVVVVEDAAQAFGAHLNGAMAGSFGLVNSLSMNPMKVFCAYGEAGAIVTDDEKLYQKLLSLRYAGTINKENCHYPSLNGRLDTIQAAMLLVNFKYLQNKIERRREIAEYYSESLNDVVIWPRAEKGYYHIYYTYTIITEKRDELKEYLQSCGIETKIHHPILMPYHTAYTGLPKFNLPVAEKLVNCILSIPNHENLMHEEREYITTCIRRFYGFARVRH
ncbi:MAG: DegT/DnrJ/EryC1/StrS family aminotransferase [Candidatus Aminicenantaceae bacterium]